MVFNSVLLDADAGQKSRPRVHVQVVAPHMAAPHWPDERLGPNMYDAIPVYISSYTIVSTTYLREAYETKINFKLWWSTTGYTRQSWSMSGGCIHSNEVNCVHQRGSLSRTCTEAGGVLSSARMCKLQKEKKRVWGWFDSCCRGWRRSDMIWIIDFGFLYLLEHLREYLIFSFQNMEFCNSKKILGGIKKAISKSF
jgi:hypothetical protein